MGTRPATGAGLGVAGIVLDADRMLMHGGVDGIKNYYTLSWYLDHNVSDHV